MLIETVSVFGLVGTMCPFLRLIHLFKSICYVNDVLFVADEQLGLPTVTDTYDRK